MRSARVADFKMKEARETTGVKSSEKWNQSVVSSLSLHRPEKLSIMKAQKRISDASY